MPKFELYYGSQAGAEWFKSLDSFTQGYVEAIFFTECHSDNPELAGASVDDLSDEARKSIIEVCADFQQANAETLNAAYHGVGNNYDESQAGTDFWFTRNGHGAGFWDRGLENEGDLLSDASTPCGSCDVYMGDDGKVYLS